MATVTALFAFYFFFASFTGIFKFLKWRNGDRKTGIPTSISEAQKAYSFVSGQQEKYSYNVQVDEGNSVTQYQYIETKGKKQEHKIELNKPVEFVVDRANKTAITYDDFEQLKKNLYLNPVFCVGCIIVTVLLIALASSL